MKRLTIYVMAHVVERYNDIEWPKEEKKVKKEKKQEKKKETR